MNDQERYEILKKEVDAIQIQLGQEHGPWYKKPSNLISAIALLFSFGTTVVSYVSAHNQDVGRDVAVRRGSAMRVIDTECSVRRC